MNGTFRMMNVVEDFFSSLPEVTFHTFFELPYSTFFDVWELLLKIANGRGISMFGVIFSFNTGSRWSICNLQTFEHLFPALLQN